MGVSQNMVVSLNVTSSIIVALKHSMSALVATLPVTSIWWL